ncbi:MAG: DUF1295 domain-containing protein [Hyphomicrobiaceae bacterium]
MSTNLIFGITFAAGAFMSAVMALAWAIQQRTGQSGWVDACWTFGVGAAGVVAGLTASLMQPGSLRPLIVTIIAAIWSLRLGLHIVARTRGAGDDPRYAKMREAWGSDAPRRMFRLLQIQALVSVPLVLAIALAAWDGARPLGLHDLSACLLVLVALGGEALADAQLRAFARDPANRGRVCRRGLWRYSRHPNYFFEWLIWLAYPLFAIDLTGGLDWGYLSIAAPAIMYWLLTRVSGIPLLEQHMVGRYGDLYREYQRTTNAFLPFPPSQ